MSAQRDAGVAEAPGWFWDHGLWIVGLGFLLSILLAVLGLQAAEHHGHVKFGGLPVPGATVTATQGDKKFVAVTDQQGDYSFPDLPDGTWTIQVEMLCFSTVKQDVAKARELCNEFTTEQNRIRCSERQSRSASGWRLETLESSAIVVPSGPAR